MTQYEGIIKSFDNSGHYVAFKWQTSANVDKRPTQLYALIVRVQQECAEAVGHVVVGQKLQIVLTEFKLHGELQMDL